MTETTDLQKTLKPGQSVRIELVGVPRARAGKLTATNVFRHSKEVAARWNEHNGEPRKRESIKVPRKIVRRRRSHNFQRYQLNTGASCEIHGLTTSQINDIASIGRYLKVDVVKSGERKPYVVGFGKS